MVSISPVANVCLGRFYFRLLSEMQRRTKMKVARIIGLGLLFSRNTKSFSLLSSYKNISYLMEAVMRKVMLIISLTLILLLMGVSTASAEPPASGGFWHRVRYGETLSSIGYRYGVNPYAICNANRLYNCNYIRAGQRLWIPPRATPSWSPRYDTPPRYNPCWQSCYPRTNTPYHPYRPIYWNMPYRY